MGVRLPSVFAIVPAAIQISSAGETIAVTTPPINLPLDGAALLLYWFLDVSSAAGATAGVFRIRRGATLAGTVIQTTPSQDTFFVGVAGGTRGGCYIDTPGNVAGIQYTLTAQMVGQAGNGQIRDGCLIVMVL